MIYDNDGFSSGTPSVPAPALFPNKIKGVLTPPLVSRVATDIGYVQEFQNQSSAVSNTSIVQIMNPIVFATQGLYQVTVSFLPNNSANLVAYVADAFFTSISTPTIDASGLNFLRYLKSLGSNVTNSEFGMSTKTFFIEATPSTLTWYLYGRFSIYTSGSGVFRSSVTYQLVG